jgi:hypothetical protein
MRSDRLSLRVPTPLNNAMKKVCKDMGFKNVNACWNGSAIILVQVSRMLPRIVQVANAAAKRQDFVLDKWFAFPTDLAGMVDALKRLDK